MGLLSRTNLKGDFCIMQGNDLYLLTNGSNGCDVSDMKIEEITEAVQGYYRFSSPTFWAWKTCGESKTERR